MENSRTSRFPSPFHPVFGRRWVAVVVVASACVPLILTITGVLPWRCPIRWATGWPCFGCGTVRSLRALASLDLGQAVSFNPFAPVYLAVLCVLAVPVVAGNATGDRWIRWVREKDGAFGISILVVVAQVVWGILRTVTDTGVI